MPLLDWLTRDDDIHAATRAPYRLLEEVSEHSNGDRNTGNMLIQGDNLEALKALLPSKNPCRPRSPKRLNGLVYSRFDDQPRGMSGTFTSTTGMSVVARTVPAPYSHVPQG